MLKLLEEIELRRQSLRRKILRHLDLDDESYYGVALMLLGLALITAPSGIVTFTPSITVALGVGIVGLIMIFTIILLPVGIFLL
ncbi:hypothetical protein ACFLXV_04115 [Chloroflexota bacterium]